MTRLFAGLLFVFTLTAAAPALALDSGRYANVYLAGESLDLKLGKGEGGELQLLDAQGGTVARARAAGGRVAFGRQPPGYYEAVLGGRRLALVVIPDPAQRVGGVSRIGIDNGMAWLVEPAQFRAQARLLRQLGFGWVRERMKWAELEPKRGRLRWGKYEQAVAALAAEQLQVLEVFHSAPPWARADRNLRAAPDDLRDVYRFARALGRQFRGRVHGWEAWNEPDIAFFSQLASEMAAYQKAAFLGFRAGDPQALVLTPSIAVKPGAFAEHLLDNGAGAYADAWNYHQYVEVGEFAAYSERHRALLRKAGLRLPLWITESGMHSGWTKKPTPERRLEQAAFVSRALPQALADGVDRYFWFLLPYLQFSRSDWGLILRDRNTPTPALATLALTTYALGRGEPLGLLKNQGAGNHAVLFERGDGTRCLALWREQGSARVSLPLDWREVREGFDHLGRALPRGRGKVALSLSSGAQFLILPPRSLDGQYTPAEPTLTAGRGGTEPSPRVLRLRLDGARLDRRHDRYRLKRGKRYALTAELYNFSSKPVRVELRLQGAAAQYAAEQRFTLEVPPEGRGQRKLALNWGRKAAAGRLELHAAGATPAILELAP